MTFIDTTRALATLSLMVVMAATSISAQETTADPEGMEDNWVETIPGKSWFMILRLYGPLEPWFDQTWRPGEIELVSK